MKRLLARMRAVRDRGHTMVKLENRHKYGRTGW